MAAFLGVIAINIVIAKTGGIPVKYKQTYIGGIPSEHYFAAKEAGIDVLALQLHVTEEEAAIAVKNALVEAGIMTPKKRQENLKLKPKKKRTRRNKFNQNIKLHPCSWASGEFFLIVFFIVRLQCFLSFYGE